MTGPWSISIPFRWRDEPLVDVAAHARHLGQDEDRATARQLVISAQLDGVATTAGELLDHLEQLDPAQRRALLDRARAEAGLPSTTEVDFQRQVEAFKRQAGGPPSQMCPADDCTNVPINSVGVFAWVDMKKWWCPVHQHLASDGDLQPRGSGLRLSPAGVPVPDDPADDERERNRREIDATRRAAQDEQRVVEAAEHSRSKQARDEAHRRELPEYLRPRPQQAA